MITSGCAADSLFTGTREAVYLKGQLPPVSVVGAVKAPATRAPKCSRSFDSGWWRSFLGAAVVALVGGCVGRMQESGDSRSGGGSGGGRCEAHPLDLSYEMRTLNVVRVYTGADGISHAEIQPQAAQESTYMGALLRQYRLDDPSNVVIVSGPPRFHIAQHPSPYREMFILLAGSSEIELSDGTRQALQAGSVVLFEDVSGPGHGGVFGPCGYVAVDLQFKSVESTAGVAH